MSRRILCVLCSLLLLSTGALGMYTWRLRHRVERAERYVQSGVDSVFFICSPVVRALRAPGGASPEMLSVARECLGQVSPPEAQPSEDEFRTKNIDAILGRITQKLEARELPYTTASEVESRLLPPSYRE